MINKTNKKNFAEKIFAILRNSRKLDEIEGLARSQRERSINLLAFQSIIAQWGP